MLKTNLARLQGRLKEMGQWGKDPAGGITRLPFSQADCQARALLKQWMEDLGLEVVTDYIGNQFGFWPGTLDENPVMFGSHLDTVVQGGLYDGSLGVLAGLEVIQCLQEAGITPKRPLIVANFTNEEGTNFTPDMMGSQVFAGLYPLEEALKARAMVSPKGTTLGELIAQSGDTGSIPPGFQVHAYVELHIEQGPLLENEKRSIGVVTALQGIAWYEFSLEGEPNHAGTTPMHLRKDAGYAAAWVAVKARELAIAAGGHQKCTVGRMAFAPDQVNVVPGKAVFTVDLRHTDAEVLKDTEEKLIAHAWEIAESEGLSIGMKKLARFEPVVFDVSVAGAIRKAAADLGLSHMDMTSGAGHDAQMLQAICPSAMIFIPSKRGISHHPDEYSSPADIEAGANVLLHTVLALAGY
jgi:N-carbamoyl-L-amino-acid hydrolase